MTHASMPLGSGEQFFDPRMIAAIALAHAESKRGSSNGAYSGYRCCQPEQSGQSHGGSRSCAPARNPGGALTIRAQHRADILYARPSRHRWQTRGHGKNRAIGHGQRFHNDQIAHIDLHRHRKVEPEHDIGRRTVGEGAGLAIHHIVDVRHDAALLQQADGAEMGSDRHGRRSTAYRPIITAFTKIARDPRYGNAGQDSIFHRFGIDRHEQDHPSGPADHSGKYVPVPHDFMSVGQQT